MIDDNRIMKEGSKKNLECDFCKDISCILTIKLNVNNETVDEIVSLIRFDIRAEDNLYQIDNQVLYKNQEGKLRGEFGESIDINYCPICGRKLR